MARLDRKVPWILSYRQRKYTSRKFRETEKKATEAKLSGDWMEFSRIKSLLRRVWWGIKRYKDK